MTMTFVLWLMAGMALGMILMGFLAVGMYQRGYEAGSAGRRAWRTELAARRTAFGNTYERAMTGLASPYADLSPAAETASRDMAEPGR
jgi:hypothetical protein